MSNAELALGPSGAGAAITSQRIATDVTTETTDATAQEAAATETTETVDEVDAAVSEGGEEDVSVTPDSTIWGLKRAIERIDLALTFNKAAKSEKGLKYAHIRLLEVQKMLKKGDLKNAAKAQKVHAELIAKVSEDVDEAEEKDGETEKVKEFRSRLKNNIAVLEAVKAKLEAKGIPTQGIENALAKAKLRQECREEIRVLVESGESKKDAVTEVRAECKEKLRVLIEDRKETVTEGRVKIMEEAKEIKAKRLEKVKEESETESEETETSETTESTETVTEASEPETSSEPTTA